MKSFLDFNMDYYRQRIVHYENDEINKDDIYEAKQLLKAVDDVVDEGYTELYESLEREKIVTRLRKLLKDNGEEPFGIPEVIDATDDYGEDEYELTRYLDGLIAAGKNSLTKSDNEFVAKLREFSNWIGYEPDTAYVFLLRDTLLPYLYFKDKGYKNLYPWLIGRKFLEGLCGRPGLDDDFRYPIYNAPDAGLSGYDEFVDFCSQSISATLAENPEVTEELKKLLSSIKQDKIVVVESGCYGTFPMVLASLDQRVSIKMFTTLPFLWELYGEHIFTRAYEKNRDFETLYSHDALVKYSSIRDGQFLINVSKSAAVYDKALAEVRSILL